MANKLFLAIVYIAVELFVAAFAALYGTFLVPGSGWLVFGVCSVIAALVLYTLYWIDTRGEFGRSNDAKMASWPPRGQNHSPRFGNRPHDSLVSKAKRLVVNGTTRKTKR